MADPTDLRPDEPAPETPAGEAGDGADLARRRFFRQFAGDLFHGAAGVVGAAQMLQRASAEAAAAILDPESVAIREAVAVPVVPAAPTGFRTPFRETPGILHLVDQRKLPDVLEEYRVRSASEAAFAISDHSLDLARCHLRGIENVQLARVAAANAIVARHTFPRDGTRRRDAELVDIEHLGFGCHGCCDAARFGAG